MRYLTELKIRSKTEQDGVRIFHLYLDLIRGMFSLHPKFTPLYYKGINRDEDLMCTLQNIVLQFALDDINISDFNTPCILVSAEINCQIPQLEIVAYSADKLYIDFWNRLAEKYGAQVSYSAYNVDGDKNLTNELIPKAEKERLDLERILIGCYKGAFQELYGSFRRKTSSRINWSFSPIDKTI